MVTKLLLRAKALKVYVEDLYNFQEMVQQDIVRTFKQSVEPFAGAAIVQGFKVRFNNEPSNPTITVFHPKGIGSFITSANVMVTDDKTHEAISLANYTEGAINVICAEHYRLYGSYDKVNDAFVEGAKTNIDLATQELICDRYVDACRIKVYTKTEFEELVVTDNIVEICRITAKANGIGYIDSDIVDTRPLVEQKILDNSITVEKLNSNIQIPQRYIDATLDSEINDTYKYTAQNNTLKDDLNELRSEIKRMKDDTENFPSWRYPAASSLANVNTSLLSLHKDGICKNYQQDLLANIVHEADGTYVTINEGKYVFRGETRTIYATKLPKIKIEAIDTFECGTINEASVMATNEKHFIPTLQNHQNYIVVPEKKRIKDAVIYEGTGTPGEFRVYTRLGDSGVHLCQRNVDYRVENGKLVILGSGSIDDEYIYIYYTYAFTRYDAVDFGADGSVIVTKGEIPARDVSSLGVYYPYEIANWMPKYAPSDPPKNPNDSLDNSPFYLRFWIIKNVPFTDLDDSNLMDVRFYLVPVRDSIVIETSQRSESNFTLNKLCFCTPEGTIDDSREYWSESVQNRKPYVVANVANSSCNTTIYTKEGDDVFIRCSKLERMANIRIEIEKNTGSDIFELVYFTLISASPVDDTPILINYDFTEGYHKIKIVLQNDAQFNFWGIIVGNTELQYTHGDEATYNKSTNNNYIANNLIVGSPQSVGGVTIPHVVRSLWSGFGCFKGSVYTFNSDTTSYYVYNTREEVWSQRAFAPPTVSGDEIPIIVGAGKYLFTNDFIFIAPRNTDKVYYSADGINWNTVFLGTNIVLKNMRFVNNALYLIMEFETSVFYRISGNFTLVEQLSFPTISFWLDINYFNGKYIAYNRTQYCTASDIYDIGQATIQNFKLSTGGNYDIAQPGNNFDNIWLTSLIQENYFNFCLIGNNNKILISKDLENWELKTVPKLEKIIEAVYLQDYIFVIPSTTGNVRANFYLRTLDFENWEESLLIEETSNNLVCAHNTNIYLTRPYGANVYDYRVTNTAVIYGDMTIVGNFRCSKEFKANFSNDNILDNRVKVYKVSRTIDAVADTITQVIDTQKASISDLIALVKLKQVNQSGKIFSFEIVAKEAVKIEGFTKVGATWECNGASTGVDVSLSAGQAYTLAPSIDDTFRYAELYVTGNFVLNIREAVGSGIGNPFIGSAQVTLNRSV